MAVDDINIIVTGSQLCDMISGQNPYLSNEGVPNRCAFPLGAQKILHVSCRIENSESDNLYFFLHNLNRMQDVIKSPVSFPQNLGWTQALRQTELVLWWAPRMERSQGLPTSQPAGSQSPGPSSRAGRGTCRDWGSKMEVVEDGSRVVAGEGSFHT